MGSQDAGGVRVSGAGQPGSRHGQGAGRDLCHCTQRCSTRSTAALGDKLSSVMLGGARRQGDTHRERAAGADGGVARCHARARSRSGRRTSRATPSSSPAIRSASIRRWRRQARSRSPMPCALCASAARHAAGGAGWRGRDGGAARAGVRAGGRDRSRSRAGRSLQAANDNGGGQVVVSGHKAAVERAVEIAKAKGARRAMMLPVSAPFHSRADAAGRGGDGGGAVEGTVKPPCVPLVANVHGGAGDRARTRSCAAWSSR